MGLSVFVFRQLISKAKERSYRRALTRNTTVLWHLFSRESPRISTQTLHRQKLESLLNICALHSIGPSLLVFTQLYSKFARTDASKPARKQNLTRNSHSRSFKVMHFGITEKPTTDCVSLCNDAGLISNVSEELTSKNAENCRFNKVHNGR